MKYLLLVLILFLLIVSIADARIYKVSYTEPTTNSDGSVLTDLALCSLYYQIQGGNIVKDWDNVSTAPTGGGVIVDKNTSDIPVTPLQVETTDFWMTCTDTGANQSLPTTKVRLQLIPTFPAGIIIK